MKNTGIVRRIDDLGRVVIPRDIRRTLGIQEGDPFEICLENGNLVLVKYQPENDIITSALDDLEGCIKRGFCLTKEMKNKLDNIEKLVTEGD